MPSARRREPHPAPRRWHALGLVAALAAAGCSDSPSPIVDAMAPDAPALDATRVDAPDLDAPAPDAAAVDAAAVDATAADALDVDAVAATTQSDWAAASGLLPTQVCVPWELTDTSTPEAPVQNLTELILGNDADAEAMYYLHPEAVLALPAVLVIEARMEFGSGGSQGPSRSGAAISFAEGPTDRKNALFIDDGVVFLLASENARGASAAVATTDMPHTYRIEVTMTTGAIAVFRDAQPLLTGALFVSPYDVPTAIYFGESSVVAHGTSIWERVTHNALAPVACP
ncbi:MAG: hypothetical protein IPL61_08375 [Myxococcales bacterium]|nr:hypothetical protein [Myxococcales bacterium]